MSLSALLVLLVPCKLTFLRYSNQLQRFFQLSQTLYHPYAILYLLSILFAPCQSHFCPPASGGVARSRAARTGCGLRGSGSGAPQAGRKAVGGSEGGAGDSILGPLGGSAARSACPNPENPPQNGSFSFVADPEAPFLPILPQDVSAVAPAAKIFRSQGSKSDPVLHIQYPPAWADVAQNGQTGKWRCLLHISRKRLVGDE